MTHYRIANEPLVSQPGVPSHLVEVKMDDRGRRPSGPVGIVPVVCVELYRDRLLITRIDPSLHPLKGFRAGTRRTSCSRSREIPGSRLALRSGLWLASEPKRG